MKYILALFIPLLLSFNLISQSIDEKVDSVLALMSIEEKIGQMTQVERGSLSNTQDLATFGIGSILSGGGSSPNPNTATSWANMYDNFQSIALQSRLGIPMIYGVDAVHGHNNVHRAVIFPHNIGMGCTWNPELVQLANEIVALEVAATGIDWTFAPCIAVPRDERWGRTYEGFGETAEIQKIMAAASVLGLQGNDLSSPTTILACAKHYVGDGGTDNGKDQGNTIVSEQILRAVHMPGYVDAIEAGVGTIMASYNSWNGQKLHGHEYLLTEVLKNELGFDGFIISDWKGVDQIDENFRVAIKRGINAGIDMVMVPDRYEVFIGHLLNLVQTNEVSIERIDDAVSRILKQKFLLNLFDQPYANNALLSSFGSQAHRNIAKQAVSESLVLLNAKNDILPLKKDGQKIMVAGKLAKDLGAQCGGWTITWQGANGNITEGTDLFSGIENVIETSELFYSENGENTGSADVAIVVIGEKTPYSEGAGDRGSLDLDSEDLALLKKIKREGIPTIALLISGRPMIISEYLPYSDAFISLWYPGSEGQGVAEVLFGDYNPSGKLTHSWPKDMSQIPINYGDSNYKPLFPYKHGLQDFPAHSSSSEMLPYAATSSEEGSSIMLALSDKITEMNAVPQDFQIMIESIQASNIIEKISVAEYDESMLIIELSEVLGISDKITLSYTGDGIYSASLSLDQFENFYVNNAVNGSYVSHLIPGKIEAENYFEMMGIQTETCTDIGGGLNVGYIEPGDWMKYNVKVTESGLYKLDGRIAGYKGGSLLITFDESVEAQIDYNATNGWQNWKTFSTEVQLEEGNYIMQAKAQQNEFNINYFDFELLSSTNTVESIETIENINVYPNPVQSELFLEFYSIDRQNIKIKLFNYAGNEIQSLFEGYVNTGKNQFVFTMDYSLPEGIYFIEIKDGNKRYFKKLIK